MNANAKALFEDGNTASLEEAFDLEGIRDAENNESGGDAVEEGEQDWQKKLEQRYAAGPPKKPEGTATQLKNGTF